MERELQDAEERIDVDRRTSPLFRLALEAGLPLEAGADPDSASVVLRRPAARSAEEWLACKAFLDRCMRQIQDQGRAALKAVHAQFEAGLFGLGGLLDRSTQIQLWEWRSIKAYCRCDSDEFIPELPDWKTPDDEEDFRFLGYMYSVFGAAGLAAAAISSLPTGAIFIAAGAVIIGQTLNYVAGDPPDPDFDELPVVETLGPLDPGLAGFSSTVAAALGDMEVVLRRQIVTSRALLSAIEKSQGAEMAGDASSRDAQLGAAAGFAVDLANQLEAVIGARTAWIAALRADGISALVGENEIIDVVLPLFIEDPPDEFVSVIQHYGDGKNTPEEMWRWVGASLFRGQDLGGGVFPEMLNIPELVAAEASVSGLLRTLADRWRN